MGNHIRIDRHGAVGVLTIARRQRFNSLDVATAQDLRKAGLQPGDGIAAYLANDDDFFDLYWACHRTGLYFTPVNWHLQEDEIQYIVDNCDAKLLVAHARFAELAARVASRAPKLEGRFAVGGEIAAFRRLEDALADVAEDAPLASLRDASAIAWYGVGDASMNASRSRDESGMRASLAAPRVECSAPTRQTRESHTS